MNDVELVWRDKTAVIKPRPVRLAAIPGKSCATIRGYSDNLLIRGDNYQALTLLLPAFAGKVKCVYIDPPYNTGRKFTEYDDRYQAAEYLSMMRARLDLLRQLLASDGSLWISCDDRECHYLKLVTDELFGRANFVVDLIWQRKYAANNNCRAIAPVHDHILVYRKSGAWRCNQFQRSVDLDRPYKYVDSRGRFMHWDYTIPRTRVERPDNYYPIIHPRTGRQVWPKETRVWAYPAWKYAEQACAGLITWGPTGNAAVPSIKKYLHELKSAGTVQKSIWMHGFAGSTTSARKEVREIFADVDNSFDFSTPKPEKLISRVLELATGPGDLVLDAFAGSGTTAAVAHKMGRRWIAIERGEHLDTLIVPRLIKIIRGREPGGITSDVGWRGGGGFRYYAVVRELARTTPRVKTLAPRVKRVVG